MSEFKEKTPQGSDSPSQRVRHLKQEVFRWMDQMDFHNQTAGFAEELQSRHLDFSQYRAYHWMIGSTPPEQATKEDFEGEDSIEKFLQALLDKYSKKS